MHVSSALAAFVLSDSKGESLMPHIRGAAGRNCIPTQRVGNEINLTYNINENCNFIPFKVYPLCLEIYLTLYRIGILSSALIGGLWARGDWQGRT